MLLRITFIYEAREACEHGTIGHVVAVDHDEARIYRAFAVNVRRAVCPLAEHVFVEVCVRRVGRCLDDGLVYARARHLDPSDYLFREIIPINLSFQVALTIQASIISASSVQSSSGEHSAVTTSAVSMAMTITLVAFAAFRILSIFCSLYRKRVGRMSSAPPCRSIAISYCFSARAKSRI